MKKKLRNEILSGMLVAGMVFTGMPASAFASSQNVFAQQNFTDVSQDDWFSPAVAYVPLSREARIPESLIKKQQLADLTDVLSMKIPGENAKVSEKIAGGFTESTLTNPYGDGKTYLAPMFYQPCGLFYNAGLFEEKGWEVPTTWDEMWELGDKAAEEGIALFTYPTTGYLDAFFYSLLYSAGGAELFHSAACYEEGVWETEKAKACFDIIEKLLTYVHEDTVENATDWKFQNNQQLVLDNKALFVPNGAWLPDEMAEAPRADGFEWGMTAIPSVNKDGSSYAYSWISEAWIPSEAEHMDAAKKFIAYLYSDAACEIIAWYGAVQPVVGASKYLDTTDLQTVYSIYDDGAKAALGFFKSYRYDYDTKTPRELFYDPWNDMILGEMTRAQWVAEIIEASKVIRENFYD